MAKKDQGNSFIYLFFTMTRPAIKTRRYDRRAPPYPTSDDPLSQMPIALVASNVRRSSEMSIERSPSSSSLGRGRGRRRVRRRRRSRRRSEFDAARRALDALPRRRRRSTRHESTTPMSSSMHPPTVAFPPPCPPPQLICRPIRDAGRDITPPPWCTVGTIVIGRDSCSVKGECSTRTWSIARTVARFDERMEGGKEAGGGGGEASDDLMECDATGCYFSVKGGELSCYEYSPRTILFPILQAHQDPPYPHPLSTSPGLLPFYPTRW